VLAGADAEVAPGCAAAEAGACGVTGCAHAVTSAAALPMPISRNTSPRRTREWVLGAIMRWHRRDAAHPVHMHRRVVSSLLSAMVD